MFDLRRARTRKVSVRSLIAVAGAAAATFGLAQVTGTMANPTDAVTTTGSEVSTGNFYPTPLPSTASCSNSGTYGFRSANISWPSAGPGMKYRVIVVRNNGDVISNTFENGTSKRFNFSRTAQTFIARIHTVNIASGATDETRQISSGWIGQGIYTSTTADTYCSGGLSDWAVNEPWENTHTWDPTTPVPNAVQANGSNLDVMRMAPQMDVTEDAEAVESTTPEAPTTSTEAPTTTTEAPNSTPSTSPTTPTPPSTTETTPETTPTEDPKPELSDTLENGGLTAGWMKGGNKVAVVDAEGNELASGRVEKGSALHWKNGQLWVVGDTKVYRIMESPQDGTWKFYNDSGQNMPDFG